MSEVHGETLQERDLHEHEPEPMIAKYASGARKTDGRHPQGGPAAASGHPMIAITKSGGNAGERQQRARRVQIAAHEALAGKVAIGRMRYRRRLEQVEKERATVGRRTEVEQRVGRGGSRERRVNARRRFAAVGRLRHQPTA